MATDDRARHAWAAPLTRGSGPGAQRGGLRHLRERLPSGWAVLVAVLLIGPVTAQLAFAGTADKTRIRQVATSYARGWLRGDLAGVIGQANADAVDDATRQLAGVGATGDPPRPVSVTLGPDAAVLADRATQGLDVVWKLPDGTPWRYHVTLELRRTGNRWAVAWSPHAVHPSLQPGTVLISERLRAPRAPVVGAGRQQLVTDRKVVRVRLQPSKMNWFLIGRLDVLTLARLTGQDGQKLQDRVDAAGSETVDLVTLSEPQWAPIAAEVSRIPGVLVSHETRQLPPSYSFARALLGQTARATVAADVGGHRVLPGDIAGISGLQQRYDAWLAGSPGVRVSVVPAQGSRLTLPPAVLYQRPVVPGRPLVVSLDARVQTAADAALAPVPSAAALVAIDPRSGAVLAVANGGIGDSGNDRALLGRYPPGGTFTLASALALVHQGLSVDAPVACPPSFTVGGATFVNPDHTVHGVRPFRTVFAGSCDTAILGEAGRVDAGALGDAATRLGYGVPLDLGTPAFAGSVPSRSDPVGHAAAMIGQGPVLASPLAVAAATATVAAGGYRSPRLITSPSSSTAPATVPLDDTAVRSLRVLLRQSVLTGTASTLRSVQGGPVSGTTGVAPQGDGVSPTSWFTGYQGNIAFAVLVEGRQGGAADASAALAVARDFLGRLNRVAPTAVSATAVRAVGATSPSTSPTTGTAGRTGNVGQNSVPDVED